MRSINKVFIIGNLTRDPEIRRTPSEQHITTFGVATNREWMTKDGRKMSASEFHDIVCFGRLAEISHQFLKKGKLVSIEGYLKTRSWDDAQGVKKFRTEIVAEDLIMLEKRPDQPNAEPTKDQRERSERLAINVLRQQNTLSSLDSEPMQPTIDIEDPLTI